ncbi:MAG: ATPase [Rhizobiaceae bacterium]|nr:ATPase [Rhizobiaceae bacterium]
MRNLLEDMEAGLSEADPVRRAQQQMQPTRIKRFYEEVAVSEEAGGFAILLDGRHVRTPSKSVMLLPTAPAARLVADEFEAQGEFFEPSTMPVYRLVNTAIDGVSTDPQAALEDILRYASSDLLCYRAASPQRLVERQEAAWDPVLDWVRSALGARFFLAEGVMHVEQPRESIGALGIHLRDASPLRLAALHVMTTLMGSSLLAIAVDAGAVTEEAAWLAAHIDEDWNAEQWGLDAEAAQRRFNRHRDMIGASRLLRALRLESKQE